MKSRIDITAESDLAAWVARDVFMTNVDADDLACRGSALTEDWYHPGWFRKGDDGVSYFTPPAFEYRNGRLHGINGRHRAVLLFRHQKAIPMLLVNADRWPSHKLSELIQRPIQEDEIIEIPDLPFNTGAPSDLPSPNPPRFFGKVNININLTYGDPTQDSAAASAGRSHTHFKDTNKDD